MKEEEEKVRRRPPPSRAPHDSRDRRFFFRAPSAARLAPRRARTRALAARLKRNQSGGTRSRPLPRFSDSTLRTAGSGATRTRIAARNARGEARCPVLTLPSTRTRAGGPEPAHHRGRVQPAQAHTQSLQPRRTAVPRVPGYLDSVQKRRLHHGTGAYPARGGPDHACPVGRVKRQSRYPSQNARLAARARLRARARAGVPARVPAVPSGPRTLRSRVNSTVETRPKPGRGSKSAALRIRATGVLARRPSRQGSFFFLFS